MLTKKSYKYLGAHFAIAYALSALPFKWNSKLRSLSCSTSKGQLAIWYFNQLVSFIIALKYIYVITWAMLYPESRPLDKLVFDCLLVVPYTALFIWNTTLVLQKYQIADLINQILKLDQLYTDQYCNKEKSPLEYSEDEEEDQKPKDQEQTDGCDANIFASLSMMFVYAALTVSMFLKNPTDPRYWYNEIVALSGDTSAMMLYNWAVMEYLQLIRFCFVFNNIFYIFMLYAHTTNFWLHQLSSPKPAEEKDILVPVQLENVLKIYKQQQVLNKHLNECCSSIIFPAFKILNVLLHIMASYVTIMFHDRLPISGFMIFPIGFVMWFRIENDVYPLLGNIHELSGSYLTSWRPTLQVKAERDLRALPQIGIMVSNAYMIEKDTILSVWSFVSGQVVNLIVMTP